MSEMLLLSGEVEEKYAVDPLKLQQAIAKAEVIFGEFREQVEKIWQQDSS